MSRPSFFFAPNHTQRSTRQVPIFTHAAADSAPTRTAPRPLRLAGARACDRVAFGHGCHPSESSATASPCLSGASLWCPPSSPAAPASPLLCREGGAWRLLMSRPSRRREHWWIHAGGTLARPQRQRSTPPRPRPGPTTAAQTRGRSGSAGWRPQRPKAATWGSCGGGSGSGEKGQKRRRQCCEQKTIMVASCATQCGRQRANNDRPVHRLADAQSSTTHNPAGASGNTSGAPRLLT
jgi:hypothetical protein